MARVPTPSCDSSPPAKVLPGKAGLRQARQLGLGERVEFLGQVPWTRMGELFSSADAFVFRAFRDFVGTVILEAMSRRLPLIALDHQASVASSCGRGHQGPVTLRIKLSKVADAMKQMASDRASRLAWGTPPPSGGESRLGATCRDDESVVRGGHTCASQCLTSRHAKQPLRKLSSQDADGVEPPPQIHRFAVEFDNPRGPDPLRARAGNQTSARTAVHHVSHHGAAVLPVFTSFGVEARFSTSFRWSRVT